MRIAQVAPLYESVPPELYGGTERVVHYLTEELVSRGHDVTLFASGDTRTRARLFPACERALRLSGRMSEGAAVHAEMLRSVYALRREFDVIHLHVDDWHVHERRLLETPHLTTVHGRLDSPERNALYRYQRELSLVSISDAQRAPLPHLNWFGTVYHGIPKGHYTPRFAPQEYLAFVGRISAEKRVDRAIEIAGRFGMKLKVAAKVDNADYAYYRAVKGRLREPWVEFVGEINEREKNELLGHALALLFPIDWPEPFGLAMVEAMLCGTPVIAWRNGSTPEIVNEGVTGFVVDSIASSVSALGKVQTIDRRGCVARATARFSAERMAADYDLLYRRRAAQRSNNAPRRADDPTRSEPHAEPGE